jgi:hypothetical protein
MLVAHLDTVHKQLPSIICYSMDGDYMMSPQGIGGDDRCGVYIILCLLNQLPFRPYVLFTMGEEVGCVGAKAFMDYMYLQDDIPDLKYIVEYDRKGNKDCVFYQCDNKKFTKFVTEFGFVEAYGSCSDISYIAPEFGVAAVNLSSGYFNPHTQHEYVCMSDMEWVIEASLEMLCAESEHFKYIKKAVPVYKPKAAKKTGGCYKGVSVTILPAGSVMIKFSANGSSFRNIANEVAVDKDGNFYRYYRYYQDWEREYLVESIDGNELPKYDAKKSSWISVYNYGDEQTTKQITVYEDAD